MNEYTWIWEGQTRKGKCVWWTWFTPDGALSRGTQWSGFLENEIIAKTKEAYYSAIFNDFENKCTEQGVTAALKSIEVQCEIVKDPEQVSWDWLGPLEYGHTQPFIVKVKGTVVFESSQELAGSPVLPALIIIIAVAIAIIIVAVGVAWGIYEFLRTLTLTETKSTITVKKYDAQGNLIEERTEDITTKGPDYMTILIIGGLIIVGVLVIPELLRRSRGTAVKGLTRRLTRKR